jgi:hypothetical protein
MKKKTTTEKTAIQITPNQKATTTVANVAGKVKTGAFGVATGAGIAGTMMMQNERGIRNRKARAEYHKKVEAVCTVAVGAAVVGAGAAIVQSIFDPVVDVSMLEIEPAAYVELNDKGSAIQEAREAAQNSNADEPAEDEGAAEDGKTDVVPEQNADQHVEKVVAEIVQTEQPASAPKAAEKPIVEATATEVQTPDPKDGQPASSEQNPAPVAPQAEQPVAPTPAEKPADAAAAAQTNKGNSAQDAKSKTGKQQPKDNGQGASNNNGQNGNNKNANAAK